MEKYYKVIRRVVATGEATAPLVCIKRGKKVISDSYYVLSRPFNGYTFDGLQKTVRCPQVCFRGYHLLTGDYRGWMRRERCNRETEKLCGVRFEVWEVEVPAKAKWASELSVPFSNTSYKKFAVSTLRFVKRIHARAPKDV